jgi:hypothetical protein
MVVADNIVEGGNLSKPGGRSIEEFSWLNSLLADPLVN